MKKSPKILILFASIILLDGCATQAHILTGLSTNSPQDASLAAQEAIRSAEDKGCKAISLAGSSGIGLVINDNCEDCEKFDENKRHFGVHVLMACPKGTTLSN